MFVICYPEMPSGLSNWKKNMYLELLFDQSSITSSAVWLVLQNLDGSARNIQRGPGMRSTLPGNGLRPEENTEENMSVYAAATTSPLMSPVPVTIENMAGINVPAKLQPVNKEWPYIFDRHEMRITQETAMPRNKCWP
jgi:hypothetical protein